MKARMSEGHKFIRHVGSEHDKKKYVSLFHTDGWSDWETNPVSVRLNSKHFKRLVFKLFVRTI